MVCLALDLVIRGEASRREPREHLERLLLEYSEPRVILFGETAEAFEPAYATTSDAYQLAQLLQETADEQVIVYGSDELLALAQHLNVGTIWVTLATDTQGMREIWRLRGQYSWLSGRRLGLLVEQVVGENQKDTERLLRIGRVTRVITMQDDGPGAAIEAVAVASMDPLAPGPEQALREEAGSDLPVEEALSEPLTDEEVAMLTQAVNIRTEGVTEPLMETKSREQAVVSDAERAEEALLQRYKLVRERRAAEVAHRETEERVQALLKELFVSRFVAGPEAAAAFAKTAGELAESAAEFSRQAQELARVEAQLAELAWLKDELEI